MAASTADLLKKVGVSTVTTLAAPGKATSATNINVGSTTNFPTDTGIVIAIRTVDSDGALVAGTYTEWSAIVNDATSFTIVGTPVLGNDQVYAAGSTTQVYIPLSSYSYNLLLTTLIALIDQDGTMAAGAVDNTAALADAIVTNAKLATSAGELGGVWEDWVPVWTNMPVSNSTVTAKKMTIGKTVHYWVEVILAGGDKPSGSVDMSFPATAATYGDFQPVAFGSSKDENVGEFWPIVHAWSTTAKGRIFFQDATSGRYSSLNATSPYTFSNGDRIMLSGTVNLA